MIMETCAALLSAMVSLARAAQVQKKLHGQVFGRHHRVGRDHIRFGGVRETGGCTFTEWGVVS